MEGKAQEKHLGAPDVTVYTNKSLLGWSDLQVEKLNMMPKHCLSVRKLNIRETVSKDSEEKMYVR